MLSSFLGDYNYIHFITKGNSKFGQEIDRSKGSPLIKELIEASRES